MCIKILWKLKFKLCGNLKFNRHLVEHVNTTAISCELICKDFIICLVSHWIVVIIVVVSVALVSSAFRPFNPFACFVSLLFWTLCFWTNILMNLSVIVSFFHFDGNLTIFYAGLVEFCGWRHWSFVAESSFWVGQSVCVIVPSTAATDSRCKLLFLEFKHILFELSAFI